MTASALILIGTALLAATMIVGAGLHWHRVDTRKWVR
jgi:hypothetical protein